MERAQITTRDVKLLEFVAEHRIVLAAHVQVLIGCSAAVARRRLGALTRAGALRRERVYHRHPPCYQITRPGLALIGSRLPSPRLDVRSLEHDVGVAWLWLMAREGTFGELRELISERRMRSDDAARRQQDLTGVRLGGLGPRGAPRIHYPDLLLIDRRRRRLAVELELSSKGRRRREGTLAGYGADPRIAAVLYLTPSETIARAISTAAERLGLGGLIHVQSVCPPRGASAPTPALERSRAIDLARETS